IAQSRWRSASWTSALWRLCRRSTVPSACARVNIAMSVATWSLRDRAVCSLPPTAPTISVSRRSIAMWMSSSSGRNSNVPVSSSSATRSSPLSSASRSASEMMPASASILAWARDCSRSSGPSRQSKPIEALSCWNTGSCGSEKRDIRAGIMTDMTVVVRPATPGDPADELLYLSAKPYYDAYAGSEARARALLAAVYRRTGHAASFEVCEVPEVDGEVAGVMASFPVSEGDERARRFVSLTAPRVPPWRWPALLRHVRAAGSVSPHPPPGMLYVDALAVDAAYRRRGVASALLAHAEATAVAAELDGVALDTGLQNEPARALYTATG